MSWLPPSFPQWLHHTNTYYRRECDSASSTQGENLENLTLLCFCSLSAFSYTLSESTTACWQCSHFKSILSHLYVWVTSILSSCLLLCTNPRSQRLYNSLVLIRAQISSPHILICDSKSGQDSQLPFWLLRGVISSMAEKSCKPHQPQCNDTAFTQL